MAVKIGRVVWPGPIGIGAGIAKNGASLLDLSKHADSVEIGSITRHMREGNVNQGQIIWKYPEEKGMRHNAGLPNIGVDQALTDLKLTQYQLQVPWGLNLAVSPGLNNPEDAKKDILESATILLEGGLRPHWLTLNISSPDTTDSLDMLQDPVRVRLMIEALIPLLRQHNRTPLWLKIAPNTPLDRLRVLSQIFLSNQVEAIICSNTLQDPATNIGGWSGTPLKSHARALAWQTIKETGGHIPIIGLGGIMNGQDVKERVDIGVSAVQIVTAILIRGREAAHLIHHEYEQISATVIRSQEN